MGLFPEEIVRLVSVLPVDGGGRPYTYRVTSETAAGAVPGALVRVPLGRTTRVGIVTRLGSDAEVPPGKLKNIASVVHDSPALTPELLKLMSWISGYYAAPLNSVLETMLPAVVRKGVKPAVRRVLEIGKTPPAAPTPKRAAVLAFVKSSPSPTRAETLEACGVTGSVIDALVASGALRENISATFREAYAGDNAPGAPVEAPEPDAAQRSAGAEIRAALDSGKHRTLLLHGVTGSGKTEVYLAAILRALETGGSALYLVPEVALTPQTVGRLRARLAAFGERVVVWHSHLSDGERFDAWMSVARGESRVVVGARSAVFLPLKKLRLVVVDEEHEASYKQGETPLYHARDVAVYRASLNDAVCVLGSATPSLESMHRARSGKYALLRLGARIGGRPPPPMRIVDMKREVMRAKGPVLISDDLAGAIRLRLARGEQSVLLLNRRGHARAMICPDCGHVAQCPHCSVPMTYHRTDETLRCHLCEKTERAPSACPECRSLKIRMKGFGTQRVEEAIRELFPKARLARIDADTMRAKTGFRRALADFGAGKIDILLGTQMIAKGLDFPRVTLAAVIDADITLHAPDFRAAERTFQLLTQLAGRAGRGELPGEVIVQTMTPHASPIQYAKRGDCEGFYDEEAEYRLTCGYPPHTRLIRHLFRGPNAEKTLFTAEQFVRALEEKHPGIVEIRGPAACLIEKIRDQYRFQIWYTCDRPPRILPGIFEVRKNFPFPDDVSDLIDVDPMETS